ncbi:GrpE protein homolog, mitochondrial, putative [Plasmodium vinckei lentum]|uniref:GrpE protein homolog, mitochondrial, putative n=1 Tax=Plasmodium vinckei lentum TaxID=138297 RepID=A0A6V7S474_PLAVN|nr:GrpE protein homolog, mitochondrial, putative [Plasmodium vinckei lentum]
MKYANMLKRSLICNKVLNIHGGKIQSIAFRKCYTNFLDGNKSVLNVTKRRLFSSQSVQDKAYSESSGDGNTNNEQHKENMEMDSKNSECNDNKKNMSKSENSEQSEEKNNKEINYESYNKIDLINEIKKAKKDMDEKLVDNQVLKEKYLSVLAEKENLRTRYMKEIENSKLYCISNFAKSLLDVADNLSLAIKNISEESLKSNEEINNIYKGIEMTETILHNIFSKYGIDKYNPINEKFNPMLHEAIFEVSDTTKEKGTVATVIQPGYKINDRILR